MAGVGGEERGRRPRRPRKDGWTDKRRKLFLAHLAGSSSIRRALQAVGLSAQSLSKLVERDPEFAAAMARARGAAFDNMESMLVERAVKPRRGKTGAAGETEEETEAPDPETMDTALALDLLRLRDAQRKAGAKPSGRKRGKASVEELTEAILALLAVLNRRLGKAL